MLARRPRQTIAKRERTGGSITAAPAAAAVFPLGYRNQHDAFMTMVYAGMDENNEKITLEQAIHDWWNTIMQRPFPAEGGNAYDLVLAMQYQSIKNSFDRHNMQPSETFLRNWKAATTFNHAELSPGMHSIVSADRYGKLGSIHINSINGGEEVATRRVKGAAPAASAPVPSEGKKKAAAVDSREPLSKYVMGLIVAQTLTDAQIAAACAKKYPDRKVTANIAALYREAINSGSKEGSGFPAPKKPYVEIGGEEPAPAVNAKPRARAQAEPKGAAPAPAQQPTPTVRRRARA